MSLATKKMVKKYEKRKADGTLELEGEDELDLFRRDRKCRHYGRDST